MWCRVSCGAEVELVFIITVIIGEVRMQRSLVFVALASIVLASGCCKKKPEGDKDTKQVAAQVGGGLKAASNNPAVVKATQAVLECPWNKGFSSSCEAMKAWEKLPEVKGGAADATFVNFLADEDIKVQYLGLRGLSENGVTYRTDAVLADKVFGYAEGKLDTSLAEKAGDLAAGIDLEATNTTARAIKLMQSGTDGAVRASFVGRVLFRNRKAPGLYDLVVSLAKNDKDPMVRRKAASSFWTGTPEGKHEEVCKLWLGLVEDADSDIAGNSAYHCAFWSSNGGCVGQWDALLTVLETKAKAGQVKHSMMASSLKYLYGQKQATDAQKKRVLDVAKIIVNNIANADFARGTALDLIVEKDPQGRAFAEKFKDDPSHFIKSSVKRALEKK